MTGEPSGIGQEVLYDVVDSHIAVVTLNRPAARNAVNVAVAQAVDLLVKRIEADDAIRVAILASSNDRVFCAGADLGEVSKGRAHLLVTPEGGLAGFVHGHRTKPWIAAVKGYALGGGCELALACDMIVASEDAQFGLPEVKRGLYAGGGGAYRLPRAVPRNIALELIATGGSLDAHRAAAFGLANRVVASDKVLDTALELARAIAANAPLAVRQSMIVARQYLEHDDAALRTISDSEGAVVYASDDAREGAQAFMEKRLPRWTGH
jgi:enoyl-CoA hydratase/carnithine racemase